MSSTGTLKEDERTAFSQPEDRAPRPLAARPGGAKQALAVAVYNHYLERAYSDRKGTEPGRHHLLLIWPHRRWQDGYGESPGGIPRCAHRLHQRCRSRRGLAIKAPGIRRVVIHSHCLAGAEPELLKDGRENIPRLDDQGAGPHAVQPLEWIDGAPVAWSLGNLVIDDRDPNAEWRRGALLEATLSLSENIVRCRLMEVPVVGGP